MSRWRSPKRWSSGSRRPRTAASITTRRRAVWQTCAKKVDAVLIGPGMTEGEPTTALTAALCAERPLRVLRPGRGGPVPPAPHAEAVRSLEGRVVITPHAGEMAQLLEKSRDEIEADPLGAAQDGRRSAERCRRDEGRADPTSSARTGKPGCSRAAASAWRPPDPAMCLPA